MKMMKIISHFSQRYRALGDRSRKSVVNILLSFGAKGIIILTHLLIVPMTIHYINPTQYGIWLTLSSIIAWINFFDLGFGNGMRNKVAEANAKGDTNLARQYISTAYFSIGTIVLVLFICVEIINFFLDWVQILKVEGVYNDELRKVFAVLAVFFCLDMVVKTFKSLLSADQKPGIASWIDAMGQIISLGVIFLLTKFSKGNMVSLAVFYSGIPALTILAVSAYAFKFTSYRQYSPRFRLVKKRLIKDIMNVGIQFFVIYICMLMIFQIINIVISRELGPNSVTEYNLAYKYFNIAYSVIMIIISPFWSAFTDAYHQKDYLWMRKIKKILELIWIGELFVIIFMIIISQWFYKIWIGNSVVIRTGLSGCMACFMLAQSLGTVYMYLINGIGTIRIQLLAYVFFALISWPLMQFVCHHWGLIGILLVPTFVYFVQAVLGKIQIEKILNHKASGIWIK